MPFTRPVRATHGTDADRRWHVVHGNGVPCWTCWPGDGLPPMPKSTAVYPGAGAAVDWRAEMLRDGFGDDDIPAEAA